MAPKLPISNGMPVRPQPPIDPEIAAVQIDLSGWADPIERCRSLACPPSTTLPYAKIHIGFGQAMNKRSPDLMPRLWPWAWRVSWTMYPAALAEPSIRQEPERAAAVRLERMR